MDLEDDTTVLTTLKSFNSFISRSVPPQRLSEQSVSGTLQSQYKRSMEVYIHLHHHCTVILFNSGVNVHPQHLLIILYL